MKAKPCTVLVTRQHLTHLSAISGQEHYCRLSITGHVCLFSWSHSIHTRFSALRKLSQFSAQTVDLSACHFLSLGQFMLASIGSWQCSVGQSLKGAVRSWLQLGRSIRRAHSIGDCTVWLQLTTWMMNAWGMLIYHCRFMSIQIMASRIGLQCLCAPSPNIYIHAIRLLALFIALAVIIIYSFYCVHFAMVT